MDAFQSYWDENLSRLEITDTARELGRAVMYDLDLPWYLLWTLPLARLFVTTWLPLQLRQGFGLPDPNTYMRRVSYAIFVFLTRYFYLLLPPDQAGVLLCIDAGHATSCQMYRADETLANIRMIITLDMPYQEKEDSERSLESERCRFSEIRGRSWRMILKLL